MIQQLVVECLRQVKERELLFLFRILLPDRLPDKIELHERYQKGSYQQ